MTQPVIFISYSHKDEKEKDRLLSHLGVLQHQGLIDLWSDNRIGVGADWKQEIKEAMAQAKLTILLISANFLTSDFILGEEVPTLLNRRKSEGLTIFPVIARACAWQEVSWLTKMNVRPKNGRPIWAASSRHVDEDLAAIAKEVAAIVKTGPHTTPTATNVSEKSEGTENTLSKQRIQVYLRGDFSSLSVDRKSAAIEALAAIMGISSQAIEVYRVYEGSIVFDLGIPSDAARRFRSRLETNDAQLRLLEVEKVLLEIETGKIEEWIIKEGEFNLVTSTHFTIPSVTYTKPQRTGAFMLEDDIQKLIINHSRRLQKLKELQALRGISVDPGVLIEIENIEEEIKRLRTELGEADHLEPKAKENLKMTKLPLSFEDRQRLSAELNKLPQWVDGGIMGEKGVLRAAGLPDYWINGLFLSGVSATDTPNILSNLESLGHLANRPTYYALGALVEYLINNTPHIEGKLFLAYLLDLYQLRTDLNYQETLKEKYGLFDIPALDTPLDLGWTAAQPAFSWQGPTDPDQLEAIWNKEAPFLDAVFLERGAQVAQAVCRVESESGMGTGFLVGPDLVLTNHHVIPTDEEAKATQVRFGYRINPAGQLQPGETYPVKQALRRSSTQELDYALLQLEGSPGKHANINYLKPIAQTLKINRRLYIIQHPEGEPQKVVLQSNQITYVSDNHRRVQYLTNTKQGSSGSPVCNDRWEVVALHHSAKPLPTSPKVRHIQGNEGIPMSAILPEIQDLLQFIL